MTRTLTKPNPLMAAYVAMRHSDAVCHTFGCAECIDAEANFHSDERRRPYFHEDRGLCFVRIHGAHVVRTK